MVEVHRFVVDSYSQKFPELDSLIPQPADYIRTVQVMRNEMVSVKEDTFCVSFQILCRVPVAQILFSRAGLLSFQAFSVSRGLLSQFRSQERDIETELYLPLVDR